MTLSDLSNIVAARVVDARGSACPGPKTCFTLGDLQRSLRRNVQRVFIRRVFDLANAGFDLDTIYHRLAA